MHLAGIKSDKLSANEFYEACVGGTITREDCNPRKDANTMYSKVAIMEKCWICEIVSAIKLVKRIR